LNDSPLFEKFIEKVGNVPFLLTLPTSPQSGWPRRLTITDGNMKEKGTTLTLNSGGMAPFCS
jgi:hypothetical protein